MSESEQRADPSEPESKTATMDPVAKPLPRRRAWRLWFGVLCWLVIIGLAGGGYYYYLQPQILQYRQDLAGLREDLISVANQLADTDTTLQSLGQGVALQQQAVPGLQAELDAARNELAALAARLRTVESSRSGDWVVAEAQYLVRLANQKLLIGRDTASALQLLEDADRLLFELGYPEARQAREALANDMVRLQQVDVVDYQGIYFRLSGLMGLVNQLAPPAIPSLNDSPAIGPDSESMTGWRHWWSLVIERLEPFFIVRSDAARVTLVASEQVELQRLRIQILLHEAQLGLMAMEQEIYQESLARAGQLVLESFGTTPDTTRLREQLNSVAQRQIRAEVPEITASLRAMDNLIAALRASNRTSN